MKGHAKITKLPRHLIFTKSEFFKSKATIPSSRDTLIPSSAILMEGDNSLFQDTLQTQQQFIIKTLKRPFKKIRYEI